LIDEIKRQTAAVTYVREENIGFGCFDCFGFVVWLARWRWLLVGCTGTFANVHWVKYVRKNTH
jgi:hypothetical protein